MKNRYFSRKKHLITGVALSMSTLALAGCSDDAAREVPAPPSSGNILDNADILSDSEEQNLNRLIERENGETDSARIAIFTYKEDRGDVKDYAAEVGNTWNAGDRSENGVLIAVDMDSREMYIAVADGSPISDDDAAVIAEEDIQPQFKNDNFNQGLTTATESLYATAQGNKPVAIAESQRHENLVGIIVFSIAGLLLAAVALWFGLDRRKWNRIADREIEEALAKDPSLEVNDEMRKAYRSYRRNHRKAPAEGTEKYNEKLREKAAEEDDNYTLYAENYASWLPLYAIAPSLYTGTGSTPTDYSGSTTSGSSFSGGGGFSGGGAGGSF